MAALTGTGTLTATSAAMAAAVTAALAGSGLLSATGAQGGQAAAVTAGGGVLTASSMASPVGTAASGGTGLLTAAGAQGGTGNAVLAGQGVLTASSLASPVGTARPAGSGLLAAVGVPGGTTTAATTGGGLLTATPQALTVLATGTPALSGSGLLTGQGAPTTAGPAAPAGSGLLTATPTGPAVPASPAGAGLLTVTATTGGPAVPTAAQPARAAGGPLVRAYLTVAEFRAHPTYLDLDDLIVGGALSRQDHELDNVLLRASAWCDNEARGNLGAAVYVERRRHKTGRDGRYRLHPNQRPVRTIVAFTAGPDPSRQTPALDLTAVSVDDGTQVTIPAGNSGSGWSWTGSLQPGWSGGPGVEADTVLTYTAGWPTTPLATPTLAGDVSVTVIDPAGIGPGDTLRLWDPGVEEAVQVAPTYTPGSLLVPLVNPLASAHPAGAGLSGFPPDLHLAVVQVACALLLGRGRAAQTPFQDAEVTPTTGAKGRRGGVQDRVDMLLGESAAILRSYRRVL